MEKFFKLKEHNTTVKTEIMAGMTTFLTMAYILAVNPSLLGNPVCGMDSGAVFTATALASALATFIMAFWANYPIALSAGMGLNAYFAFTVCGGDLKGMDDPWKVALAAVLVEGIIFILLSFFKVRESIVNAIPANLKYGITAGIGLFIAFLGLQGAGIVVADESTLVKLGDFSEPGVALCLIGVLITAVMYHFQVKGYILWGILITWVLGIGAEMIGWYVVDPEAGALSLIPSFTASSFIPKSIAPTFFKFDFGWIGENLSQFVIIVFSFLFVDMFDTIGTLIGVSSKANMLDNDGKLPNIKGALMADAVATTVGAVMGTSTTTTFVESASGVSEGGRTGLTAVTTAILFGLSLFLSPIFLAIPSFATAPALVVVGFYMLTNVTNIDFNDISEALPCYICIGAMPFFYSISEGISMGVISYVVLNLLTGKAKEKKISLLMYVLAVLFVLKYIFL